MDTTQTMSFTDDTKTESFFAGRKKPSKHKKKAVLDAPSESSHAANDQANTVESDRVDGFDTTCSDYTYDYLITRALQQVPQNFGHRGPNLTRITLPVLQVGRLGTTRTIFVNFGSISTILKRKEQLMLDYFKKEFGAEATIDARHAMIIKGRFLTTHIERVLRSFIKTYVACKNCLSMNTTLTRADRLLVIQCTSCLSQYSVPAIKRN